MNPETLRYRYLLDIFTILISALLLSMGWDMWKDEVTTTNFRVAFWMLLGFLLLSLVLRFFSWIYGLYRGWLR